jgi:hypothetical protein
MLRVTMSAMAMALLCMHINDVMNDPAFGDYGRLIFPVNTGYWSGTTLEQLQLTWYNYIDPDKTVEVCNYLRAYADNCFIDIYTEAEKSHQRKADIDAARSGFELPTNSIVVTH